ncbi:MAG TPA: hypothetical protein VM145_07970 [Sphingomicrobium sp.]|nr:hypothetical protein [Sphingomicrobium sp.]
MRGISSTIGGLGLLGFGLWKFVQGEANLTVMVLLASALILLFRGYQGLTIRQSVDEAMLPAQLIANPRAAAFDFAVDRIDRLLEDVGPTPQSETKPGFDPDAAIARYMETRGKPPADPAHTEIPRQFGRKQA